MRIKKPEPDPAGGFYQDDFGGFNPRFAGVTIRIASQVAYNEFVTFLTSGALPGDKEELLGPILMRSVIEHEIRHYHDFLLGSCNGVLFRARLQAILNGIEALHKVKELPGDVVPLPLSTWMVLPAEEREAQLNEWAGLSADGKKPTPIPVPILSKEALLQPGEAGLYAMDDDDPIITFSLAAALAAGGYERIQEIVQGAQGSGAPGYGRPINVAHIQEVLALTVQLGAILQAQGERQARVFVRFCLHDPDFPVGRFWRFLLDLSVQGTPGIAGHEVDEFEMVLAASFQVMAIGTWTLLGNSVAEGEAASPSERLAKLIKHLHVDSAAENAAIDVAATWDYWDRTLGLNPWRASLKASLDWASRGVDFYESAYKMSAPGWRKDVHAILHNMMKAYADDQRMLIERVLEQPEDLVSVSSYLGLPSGTLPMPLLRLQMDNSALELDSLNQEILEPVMAVDLDGEGIGVATCLLKMNTPAYRERAGDAIAFEYIAQLCDLAFSQQVLYGLSPLLRKTLLFELEKIMRKPLRSIV